MKTLMLLSVVPDGRLEMCIKEAAALSYRCVFCGEEPDERIRSMADACYVADWNDTDELIRIAEREKADGVIALCDPAVLPAARTAAALGLPGNTPESLEVLLSKDRFRSLQDKAGLLCPHHAVFRSLGELESQCDALHGFRYPLIVKPALGSSSFGQTILEHPDGMAEAFAAASVQSRDGSVCIEEYIQPRSLCSVEADVFVLEDVILWEGLRDSWHLESAPLRPLYDVYPAHLTPADTEEFKKEVSGALRAAGVRIGEYNVEGFFNAERRFFIVEINPRPAGYYNPQHIELSSGVNLTKLLVSTAVGDRQYFESLKTFRRTAANLLSYSVFSRKEGILDYIYIDPLLLTHLKSFDSLYRSARGDHVKDNLTAKWPIGQAAFVFDTPEELEAVREKIEDLIRVVLR